MYRPFLRMILEDLQQATKPQEQADILFELASNLYERQQWNEVEEPAIKQSWMPISLLVALCRPLDEVKSSISYNLPESNSGAWMNRPGSFFLLQQTASITR